MDKGETSDVPPTDSDVTAAVADAPSVDEDCNGHTKAEETAPPTEPKTEVVAVDNTARSRTEFGSNAVSPPAMSVVVEEVEAMVREVLLESENSEWTQWLVMVHWSVVQQHTLELSQALSHEEEEQRLIIMAEAMFSEMILRDTMSADASEAIATTTSAAEATHLDVVNETKEGIDDVVQNDDTRVSVEEAARDRTSTTDDGHTIVLDDVGEEIARVLLQFVHDDRATIEEEETETRDILCIEMELDRDECAAAVKRSATIGGNTEDEPDVRQQESPDINSSGEAVLRHEDSSGSHGNQSVSRQERPQQTSYAHLAHILMPLTDDLFRLLAAESYERNEVSKRWLACLRHIAAGAASNEEIRTVESWLAAFEQEEASTNLAAESVLRVPSRLRHPGPLGPHELRHITLSNNDQSTSDEVAAGATATLSHDGEHEHHMSRLEHHRGSEADREGSSVPGGEAFRDDEERRTPPRRSHVTVPDASHMSRVSPRAGELTEDELESIALYREQKRLATLREISSQLRDLANEEVVERELVSLASNEERKQITELFVSSIVEEFDWVLCGFRSRMRRPLVQHAGATKHPERHLPPPMRTPLPRIPTVPHRPLHDDVAGGNMVSWRQSSTLLSLSSVSPRPPPSSLSRLSRSKSRQLASGTASVSRLTDLMSWTLPAGGLLTHESRPSTRLLKDVYE